MNKSIKNEMLAILDQSQLKVMDSEEARIIVEAPPGYGKTKLLINKTLQDLINGKPKNHEKVLMLTFSVNSASKMREDLNTELKKHTIRLQLQLRNKVLITNFHGFARSVLSKYGYLLSGKLKDIRECEVLAEYQLNNSGNNRYLKNYATAIKEVNIEIMNQNMKNYNKIILEELLPKKILTHNSLLTLVIQLFYEHESVLIFYKRLYRKIVIDEFQDTNHLNRIIIELFLNDHIEVELYGDPLQRIYGFIGTVENIFDILGEKYNFTYYKLEENYRFKDNEKLLKLEKQIRKLAKTRTKTNENLKSLENENISIYDDHSKEVKEVVKKLMKIIEESPNERIVILTPQRGPDIDELINLLNKNNIGFFNALELDSESELYINFCLQCARTFQIHFLDDKKVIKRELNNWYKKIDIEITDQSLQYQTLKALLKAFLNNIVGDSIYRNKTQDEKKEFILSIFSNKELHYYLSATTEKVQVSTIHTSKGLEWDIVFLIDVEKDKLPNHYGMCKNCEFALNCKIELSDQNEKSFLEQLSLFYVAVTRAKKEVYISSSLNNARGIATNVSCLFNQLNINPIKR